VQTLRQEACNAAELLSVCLSVSLFFRNVFDLLLSSALSNLQSNLCFPFLAYCAILNLSSHHFFCFDVELISLPLIHTRARARARTQTHRRFVVRS
jgi:hypothetical protein